MRALVFLGAAFVLACSNGNGNGDGGTDAGNNGAATLVVNSTSKPSAIAAVSPSAGNVYAQLNVTLGNAGSSAPIGAGYAFYKVETDQSLVFIVSNASSVVASPCSPTTSIAQGGSYTCNLVFEIPTGQTPVTLLYDDNAGDTSSASVPAPAPTTCDQYDAMNFGAASCQACGKTASAGACGNQLLKLNSVCTSSADAMCLQGCAYFTCACVSACNGVDDACVAAVEADDACIYAACGSSCK